MDKTSGKDLRTGLPRFCLALEEHRRTSDGRVRSPLEFQEHFFPRQDGAHTDRLFRHVPNEVRGPILVAWGLRGMKTALRDTDEKVESVIRDALQSGDLDATMFEEGVPPGILVGWVPLDDWWTFWRGGKHTRSTVQRALEEAYDLGLFDAAWFLATLAHGSLHGTDVLAQGLSKDDLADWMRGVHQSGDGSPKGLLSALGWEKIVNKTSTDVLLSVIDAMAVRQGLAVAETSNVPVVEAIPSAVPSPMAAALHEAPTNPGNEDPEIEVTEDLADEVTNVPMRDTQAPIDEDEATDHGPRVPSAAKSLHAARRR